MLKFLSKRKRSRKALLVFFVAILAIGLVAFFGPGVGPGISGTSGNDTVIASVGDYEVTLKDLRDSLSYFGQQMSAGQGSIKSQSPETLYGLYGTQVLDNLIRQKLIQYEADQRNMGATDREVQERLKQFFNPWPGPEGYRLRLQQAGLTPVQFENNLRADISREKLRAYITGAIQIAPKEVEEDYRRTNTSYTVRWVEVSSDKFEDQVKVDDAALAAFFEERKAEFRINTEQRKSRYLFVDQKKAGESIQVSDDELKQEFNPERNIQRVRVSQIVLNVPKAEVKKDEPAKDDAAPKPKTQPELDAEIRLKAESIVSQAKGAEGKPPEDFANLARTHSEDSKTKAAGGDLGWIAKKDKRDPDDPLNQIFNMQAGEVSQPTKKGDRFYILKVTDRQLPTFEESKEQLLKEARIKKGYTRAVEIAIEVEQKFKELKDPDAVANEINAKHGGQVTLIKETPFFAEGDSIPELGAGSELETAIFGLTNIGDITERLNVAGGFAVGQYIDRRDPHDPTLDEVKSKVDTRYRNEKAKELAIERARQLCTANNPAALKALADSIRLKTDERAGLAGTDSIGPLVSEADRQPVYKLAVNQLTPEPIKISDSDTWVVAAMVARKDADMGEAFQKERKSIEERLLQSRRETFFSAFLANTQKRLKEEGRIKIQQEVINEAMRAGDTGVESGMPPGLPQMPPRSGGRTRRAPGTPTPTPPQ
jgi:peptidyl-prolyl cis-trans isomerase D